jgi:hypothetical protein
MRYTLIYPDELYDKLAGIWVAARDRAAVTAAANYIEHALRSDPDRAGIALGEARRIVDGPLAYTFMIAPKDLKVHVVNITYLG